MTDGATISIYEIDDTIKMVPESITREHEIVFELPPEVIPFGAIDKEVGAKAMAAVGRCRSNLSDAPTHADIMASALGVKGWRSLKKLYRYCSVAKSGKTGSFEIYPVKRHKGQFIFTDQMFTVSQNDPEALGQKIKEALQLCA